MISSKELAKKEFTGITLPEPYATVLGKLPENFSMAIWGPAGSGKSTVAVDLAWVLANTLGKGIYCSSEEGAGPCMQNKIKRLKAEHPDLYVTDFDGMEDLKSAIKYSGAKFCIFDSASMSHIKVSDMEAFHDYCKQNQVAFLYILHATKTGDFKGNSYLIHMPDTVLQVQDGVAQTTKNRFADTPQEFDVTFEAEERSNPTGNDLPTRNNPGVNKEDLHGLELIENPADVEDPIRENKAVSPDEIYQMITDRVIATIETAGELPWHKPWKGSGLGSGLVATNFVSKKPYRGINFFMLNTEWDGEKLVMRKFDNPYFLTFKQVQRLGGKVKKGSKGNEVVYFVQLFSYEQSDPKLEYGTYSLDKFKTWLTDNADSILGNSRTVWRDDIPYATPNPNTLEELLNQAENWYVPILKYYNVFHASDIEGIDWGELPKNENIERPEFQKIQIAEAIWEHFPNAPDVRHQEQRAFYQPVTDHINMPVPESFDSEQEYYSTLFHEGVHSTGHSSRLNREFGSRFGDEKYNFEELIAELGATFLCSESGILFHTIDNSTAYLQGFRARLLKQLEEDNRFFFRASSRAQEAADYILDRDQEGVPAYLKNLQLHEKPDQTSSDQNEVDTFTPEEIAIDIADYLLWNKGKQIRHNPDLVVDNFFRTMEVVDYLATLPVYKERKESPDTYKAYKKNFDRVTPQQVVKIVQAKIKDREAGEQVSASEQLQKLKPFFSNSQYNTVRDYLKGEEGSAYEDIVQKLNQTIQSMPELYEQDGKGDQAVAYLHYFKGGADWYITEKGTPGNEAERVFGLADLYNDGGELGYMDLRELVNADIELDLHWTPKTLGEIRGNEEPTGSSIPPEAGERYMLKGKRIKVDEVVDVAGAKWVKYAEHVGSRKDENTIVHNYEERMMLLKDWDKAANNGQIQKGYSEEPAPDETKSTFGNIGKKVPVDFKADGSEKHNGHYQLIEAADLTASHNKDCSANSKHRISRGQPRDRSLDNLCAQPKFIAKNLNPDSITRGNLAFQGAPVTTADGMVIQGNGRSIALKIAYDEIEKNGSRYKQFLADNADEFGFSESDVTAMSKPVLVRMLNVDDEEAIRLGNIVDTSQAKMNRIDQAKAMIRGLKASQLQAIGRIIGSSEGETIGAIIDDIGIQIFDQVKDLDRTGLIEKNELTSDGKEFLRSVLTGIIFDSDEHKTALRDFLDNPRTIQAGIERSFGSIIPLINQDGDIRIPLREAVSITAEITRNDAFDSVEDVMSSQDMFSGAKTHSQQGQDLAQFLIAAKTQKAIRNGFRVYVDHIKGREDLFNPIEATSQPEAFKAAFVDRKNPPEHIVKLYTPEEFGKGDIIRDYYEDEKYIITSKRKDKVYTKHVDSGKREIFRKTDKRFLPNREETPTMDLFADLRVNGPLSYMGITEKITIEQGRTTKELSGKFPTFLSKDKLFIIPENRVQQVKNKVTSRRAVEDFEEFHNYNASEIDYKIDLPIEQKSVPVGTAKAIWYASDKVIQEGDRKGKVNHYVHEFDSGKRPALVKGDVLIIGNIEWDARGLLN